ncbi:hypothetical protein FIBSPDRAFT_552572 [Athelia psychrophila]|uniref:Uncharacterized protein n=1 Tax=Athelia psychrophila TaxID=1759441 RepID=A0A166UXC3_9AGAM|nr:hypothetical protein FIBSPDRAFT_552572 [Fibularhizoctonia sp. CBS 109695]
MSAIPHYNVACSALPCSGPRMFTSAPWSSSRRTTLVLPFNDALPYFPPWAFTSAPRSSNDQTIASWEGLTCGPSRCRAARPQSATTRSWSFDRKKRGFSISKLHNQFTTRGKR